MANHVDAAPMELPHLYQSIEPDALDAIIDSLEVGSVTFEFAGEVVTVHGDGTVHLASDPERGSDRKAATHD